MHSASSTILMDKYKCSLILVIQILVQCEITWSIENTLTRNAGIFHFILFWSYSSLLWKMRQTNITLRILFFIGLRISETWQLIFLKICDKFLLTLLVFYCSCAPKRETFDKTQTMSKCQWPCLTCCHVIQIDIIWSNGGQFMWWWRSWWYDMKREMLSIHLAVNTIFITPFFTCTPF